ncbi:MAG: zinc-ribbon domain-containing protein [Actinomycetota bacterium]
MECPNCGAENSDNAEFCSLCLEKLQNVSISTAQETRSRARSYGEPYVAPGEWRGASEQLAPSASEIVRRKVHRFRWKIATYSAVLILVLAWMVLSFTLWGNPSAGDKSISLLNALNDRDHESFMELILPENESTGEELYDDTVYFLGESGEYVDVDLEVTENSAYAAHTYLVGGRIEFGSTGRTLELGSENNMVISLENRKGRWYVDPAATILIP